MPTPDAADLAARLERINAVTKRLVHTQADSTDARTLAERIKRKADANPWSHALRFHDNRCHAHNAPVSAAIPVGTDRPRVRRDHQEIMELIPREMKVAVDPLQPTARRASVARANRDEPFFCPNCQSDAIQVVTLGRTENAITVRCDNCDQYTVVVFESEQCDASSSSFKQKNRRRPSPLTLVKSN